MRISSTNTPFGNRYIRDRLSLFRQADKSARKDKLEYQQKRHDRHNSLLDMNIMKSSVTALRGAY